MQVVHRIPLPHVPLTEHFHSQIPCRPACLPMFCLAVYVGAVCGAGLLLSSRIFSLNKQGFPFPSPIKTLSGAISVLMPRNLPATLYSLLTVVFAGMALMCLGASPNKAMLIYEGLSGPMTVFMQRVTGAGMLLQTLVGYSLKDGADREKLGATTFR